MAGKNPVAKKPQRDFILLGDSVLVQARVKRPQSPQPTPPGESQADGNASADNPPPLVEAGPSSPPAEPTGPPAEPTSAPAEPTDPPAEPTNPPAPVEPGAEDEDAESSSPMTDAGQEEEGDEASFLVCALTASRQSKTDVVGVERPSPFCIEHSNVLRFRIESADLLITQVTKEEEKNEETRTVKTLATQQLLDKTKGQKIEYGSPFVLRNVEYDMFLCVDAESAAKGEWDLTFSPIVTPDALFMAKGSSRASGVGTYLQYDVPALVFCAGNKESKFAIAPTYDHEEKKWWIRAKEHPMAWTFKLFEKGNTSDSFVRFQTPVRLKLRDTNCYLRTQKLDEARGSVSDYPLTLTTNPDDIATHFLIVSTNYEGGHVGWDKLFYIRQAVNMNFLDEEDWSNIGFRRVCYEKMKGKFVGAKSTSPFVSYNSPVGIIFGGKEDDKDFEKKKNLHIEQKLEHEAGVELAATFASKFKRENTLGKVVLSESSSLFEIQQVAYEETLSYRGFNILLSIVSELKEAAKEVKPEVYRSFATDVRRTSEQAELVKNLRGCIENLVKPLKSMLSDIKNASVTEIIMKQKILSQAEMPGNLLTIAWQMAMVFGSMWQSNKLIKEEDEMEGDEDDEYEDSYYDEEEDDEEEEEVEEEEGSEEQEESELEEGSEEYEAGEGSEGVSQGESEEPASENEEPQGQLSNEEIEEINDFLEEYYERGFIIFRTSLEAIFECLKSNESSCEKLLPEVNIMMDVFKYAREGVGRILSEIFTYCFPKGQKYSELFEMLVNHFTEVSGERINELIYFAEMLKKLILGKTLEAHQFNDFVFHQWIMNEREGGDGDINRSKLFMLKEQNARYYIHFNFKDKNEFLKANPKLKDLKITEIDGEEYYALADIQDAQYTRYISVFLSLYAGFEDEKTIEMLESVCGLKTSMLLGMIKSKDIAMSLRQGALYMISYIFEYHPPEKELRIVNLREPLPVAEAPKAVRDLATSLATKEVRESIALTLTLCAETEDFFQKVEPPAAETKDEKPAGDKEEKAKREEEEKKELLRNIDKVQFITGLLKIASELIHLECVEDIYILEMFNVASAALRLLYPPERTKRAPAQTEKKQTDTFWFLAAVESVLKSATRRFDAKSAVEMMYDELLYLVTKGVELFIWNSCKQFVPIMKKAYDAYINLGHFNPVLVIAGIESKIVGAVRVLFNQSTAFSSFVEKCLAPVVPGTSATALLAEERPRDDLAKLYNLAACKLRAEESIGDVIQTVFVNTIDLGLKFDQRLVSALLDAISFKKTVASELRKYLFYEDNGGLQELMERCSFDTINELGDDISPDKKEILERITAELMQHPFLKNAKLMKDPETRFALQAYVAQDETNLQTLIRFLRQYNVTFKDTEQGGLFATGRSACLQFLTMFITDNPLNKQVVAEMIKPLDISYCIPEVADFLRELTDFDYLSMEDAETVFRTLMESFSSTGAHPYFAYKFLQNILYDRSQRYKVSVQNLIINILGQNFEKKVARLKAEIGKRNQAPQSEERKEVPEEQGKEGPEGEEGEEGKEGPEGEEVEESEEGEEGKKGQEKILSDNELNYIALCLRLLGNCAAGNNVIKQQLQHLVNQSNLQAIFEEYKNYHTLIGSYLEILKIAMIDQLEDDLTDALKVVLTIANEILQQEDQLVKVIVANAYSVIPSNMTVQLSTNRSQLSPEDQAMLLQLEFLLAGGADEVPSGIVVTVPTLLDAMQKKDIDVTELQAEFRQLFERIEAIFARVSTEEFDFSLSKVQLDKALQRSEVLAKPGMLSALKAAAPKQKFYEHQIELAERLEIFFGEDKKLLVGIASKILNMCSGVKTIKGMRCLKKLMSRVPIFPLQKFYNSGSLVAEALTEPAARKSAFRHLLDSNVIIDAFVKLFEERSIKADISILRFLNAWLDDQPAALIIRMQQQLQQQLLDVELFTTIVKECTDSLTIVKCVLDKDVPKSSYMALLSRFDYKTYGEEKRRDMIISHMGTLIRSYLLLLQRFCDGCNKPLQEYMRTQGQASDVNIVQVVVEYLCSVVSLSAQHPEEGSLVEYAQECVNTLIEFATGPCVANQTLIGSYVPVYIALNRFFEPPAEDYYHWQAGNIHWVDKYTPLRAAAVKLLLVLLEGDPVPEVVSCIDKFLVKKNIIDNLKQVFVNYYLKYEVQLKTEDESVKKIEPLILNAMDEACFLVTLLSKNGDQKLGTILEDGDWQAFRELYLPYTGYVEVQKPAEEPNAPPDASIRGVYFVIPFKCKFLPYESAVELIMEANHESHQDLTEGLLKAAEPCKEEMEHHQRIARSPSTERLLSRWKIFKISSLLVVLLSNIVLLVESNPDDYLLLHWDSWVSVISVLLLGLVQIALYTLGLTLYVMDAYPKLLAQGEEEEGIDMEALAVQPDRDSQEQKYKDVLKLGEEQEPTKPPAWQVIGLSVKWSLLYVLISLVAIPFPLLYPLLLLQVFEYIAELRTILQAITQNGVQLFYTAIFGLIVMFTLAVLCFEFYADSFNLEDNNMKCGNFFDCVASVINQGLRAGGGLGDVLGAPSEEQFWGRFIFDFVFFIIISVILLQVIFGIILDTFGEMRDARGALLEDINSVCFICGVNRSEIELYGKGWSYHFTNEHSPYAYLSFLVYLLDKDLADCSGVEKFAKEKLEKTDTTFLPSTSKMLARRQASSA